MRFAVPQLHALQNEFKHSMEFLCVYIMEAHATDEWPISSARASVTGQPVMFRQARSDEERLTVAKKFVEDYSFEINTVIDLIDNPFENLFASWPLRYYVLHKGKLIYKAQPKNATYVFADFRDFLVETNKNLSA